MEASRAREMVASSAEAAACAAKCPLLVGEPGAPGDEGLPPAATAWARTAGTIWRRALSKAGTMAGTMTAGTKE